jgi:hypothetical protein
MLIAKSKCVGGPPDRRLKHRRLQDTVMAVGPIHPRFLVRRVAPRLCHSAIHGGAIV